jgi:hypothetical protein
VKDDRRPEEHTVPERWLSVRGKTRAIIAKNGTDQNNDQWDRIAKKKQFRLPEVRLTEGRTNNRGEGSSGKKRHRYWPEMHDRLNRLLDDGKKYWQEGRWVIHVRERAA